MKKERIDFKILKQDNDLDVENSLQLEEIVKQTKRIAENTTTIKNILIFFVILMLISFILF